MMMCLGQFVFSLADMAYQDLQRQTSWRHPTNSRVGAMPARQFAGKGDDTVSLQGVIAPDVTGKIESLDTIREMADSGSAWPLVEGTGRVYGQYVIDSVTEGQTLHFQDGAPRRIDFTLSLQRIPDDRAEGYV